MGYPDFLRAPSSGSVVASNGRCIGISVSESLDNSQGREALEDFVVDIATNLLLTGHRLAYGGDFRNGGFSELLSYTAYRHKTFNPADPLIDQYIAYPITQQVNTEMEMEAIESGVRLVRGSLVFQEKDIASFAGLWHNSLSEIRQHMARRTEARIVLGGKTEEYLGKSPGLVEEARCTLERDKPLYLIGCFGGAALQVIEALQGQGFAYAASGFHQSHEYLQLKYAYKQQRGETISPREEARFFERYGLEKLSAGNGLTIEENKILFYSEDKAELLYYLFKGLKSKL